MDHASPATEQGTLSTFSSEYYRDYAGTDARWLATYRRRRLHYAALIRKLRNIHPAIKDVAELGCGAGMFSYALLSSLGADVNLTAGDISAYAVELTRQKLKAFGHVRVEALNAQDCGLPQNSFDVVASLDVAEHLPEPKLFLQEAFRILRPGGLFLVAVPNFGSPEARLTKSGWFHLDCPRHLSHHTRESLSQILTEADLSLRWVSALAPEYDNFSFVQSLLNWFGARPNLLYNLLRGQSAKVIGGKRPVGSILATGLLAPVLGVVSVPVTLLLAFLGQGATLTITAVKKPSAPELP